MIKRCLFCHNFFEGNGKRKFCPPPARCKKNYENSRRGAPQDDAKPQVVAPALLTRPEWLNEVAAAYWDRVAPTVIIRGHLNVLSADAFAELCDLYSRLQKINKEINLEVALLNSVKEGTLSELKRKYSRQFLDYCKSFYLTPMSNRGNFGLDELEDRNTKKKPDSLFD